MKRTRVSLFTAVSVAICWSTSLVGQQIDGYFSPNGGCTAAICKQIDAAKTSIDVAAYAFSSKPITNALIAAHQRGVKVAAIVDRAQESFEYSTADDLAASGVSTLTDSQHAIFHNKYLVIDSMVTIAGSFNFTDAAENRNAENLLVITDAKTAANYAANFLLHAKHSTQFKSKHPPHATLQSVALSPTKKESCYGSPFRSDVLAGCVRQIRWFDGVFQVEGEELCPQACHAEESEVGQADRRPVDDEVSGRCLGRLDRGYQGRLRHVGRGHADLALQCLRVAKSCALAVVKNAVASLAGARRLHARHHHDGDPDGSRGFRDGRRHARR